MHVARGRSRLLAPWAHAGAGQRMRIVSAMTTLAATQGANTTTVADVVGLAGVSRKTFYELFEDRTDCLLAAIDHALAIAAERVRAAEAADEPWIEQIRAGLTALLQFFDEEPQLARLCVIQSLAVGPPVFARRAEVLRELARAVDDGRLRSRRQPPPLTAESLVGGVLSVIGTRLAQEDSRPLLELVNPLMSLIVLPYRGNRAASEELTRQPPPLRVYPARAPSPRMIQRLPIRVTQRTTAVLAAISVEPGLSNLAVSERAGITDQGQMSKLLARLSHLGLAENTGGGQPRGAANSWHLTSHGKEVEEAIRTTLLGLRRAGRTSRSPAASGQSA